MDNWQGAAYAQLALKSLIENGIVTVSKGNKDNVYVKMKGFYMYCCDMYTPKEAEKKAGNL